MISLRQCLLFPAEQGIRYLADASNSSGRSGRKQEKTQQDQNIQIHFSHVPAKEPCGAVP